MDQTYDIFMTDAAEKRRDVPDASDIERRAYDIYLERRSEGGQAMEHRLIAERGRCTLRGLH